jgi:hypothetical protein
MRFLLGKSYAWIFGIFFGVFIVACRGPVLCGSGHPERAVLLLPVVSGFVLVSEIRSGIALDSWWQARYGKETWQYKAILACHALGFMIFAGIAAFFVYNGLAVARSL